MDDAPLAAVAPALPVAHDSVPRAQAIPPAPRSCSALGQALPPLPGTESRVTEDRFSAEFIQRRQAGLELFLRRLAGHGALSCSTELTTFLEAKAAFCPPARPPNRHPVVRCLGRRSSPG